MIEKKDMRVDLEAGTIDLGYMMLDIELVKAAYERIKQAEGIAKAQREGVQFGKAINVPDNFFKYYDMVKEGRISVVEAIKYIGISRAGYYRIKDRYEEGLITRED